MKNREYKGTSPGKDANRNLVWLQHKRLLGRAFGRTEHVFLASKHAGDVDVLTALGAPASRIVAVESNEDQYIPLLDRQKKEGFKLYTTRIERMIEDVSTRSVYLDFCGNLIGARHPTAAVVKYMPARSVLSVTLLTGREKSRPANREESLTKLIRSNTSHRVTLVQRVMYQSTVADSFGVPMATWTFYLGPIESRAKMTFDMHGFLGRRVVELGDLDEARKLLRAGQARARGRRVAALKAWETMRATG